MYNAFISYSHTADEKFAPFLQVALHKFAKPWYKKRNLEIFRDESNLSASPHLWNNITHALDQSEYLILLASPASEKSKWVNREIEYWLEHKSIDNLLIVLTDGSVEWDDEKNCFLKAGNNSLPLVLDCKFNAEPFYIDLRLSRTERDLTLQNPIFKKEVLKLAAKLHGMQPNDLASEEVSVHRKMIWLRNAVIGALFILLFVAVGYYIDATIEREIAISQRDTARGNFVISEAKSMLENDPTLALRLTEAALGFYKGNRILATGEKIFRENHFYKTILSSDTSAQHRNFRRIIFSRNGEFVLTGLGNSDMILWKLNGNKLDSVQYFVGNKGVLYRAVFSSDGKWLLTGSQDSVARIWSIVTGRPLTAFYRENATITNVEFQPSGKYIATRCETPGGGVGGAIARIWDTASGKPVFTVPIQDPVGITFSPNGKLILTNHDDGKSYLWKITNDPTRVKLLKTLNSNSDDGTAMTGSFSPDGKTIVIGYYNNVVRIYNLNGKPILTQVQNQGINKVFFPYADVNELQYSNSELSGYFFTGGYDGIISKWSYRGDDNSAIKTTLEFSLKVLNVSADKFRVWDIVQLRNGNILAAYSDGKVRLWDMRKEDQEINWQDYLKSNKTDTLPTVIKRSILPK